MPPISQAHAALVTRSVPVIHSPLCPKGLIPSLQNLVQALVYFTLKTTLQHELSIFIHILQKGKRLRDLLKPHNQ